MGQPTPLHCGAVCGGVVREGTILIAQLLPHFKRLALSLTTTTVTGFYCQRFWGFICIVLEPWVHGLFHFPVVPPSLSSCECETAQYTNCCLEYQVCQPLLCLISSLPWLPISTPPTSHDECFFFNSLVVGLPYSSIFWQFWVFFFLIGCFLLLIGQGGETYLSMPPSWPNVSHFCYLPLLLLFL